MVRNDPGGWPDGFRGPHDEPRALRIHLFAPAPGNAEIVRQFQLAIPRATSESDEVLLWSPEEQIRVPIADLVPSITSSVHYRLELEIQRVASEMVTELTRLARMNMEKLRY